MKLFKCKDNYSVCKECLVHFEPVLGGLEEKWKDLCSVHRKPVIEKYLRLEHIAQWAKEHPEKVEPMMLADQAEKSKIYQAAAQAGLSQAMQSQQQAMYGGLAPFGTRLEKGGL